MLIEWELYHYNLEAYILCSKIYWFSSERITNNITIEKFISQQLFRLFKSKQKSFLICKSYMEVSKEECVNSKTIEALI